MSAPTVAIEVANRVDTLRRKYGLTRIAIVCCVALSLVIGVWILLATLDYFYEYSQTTRRLAATVCMALIVVWFVSRLMNVFRVLRQNEFVALLENSLDGFGQRIRTVLDTVNGRVSGPEEMLTALGNQTLGRWETLSPSQLIPMRGLMTSAVICLGCGLLATSLCSSAGDMNIAMQRILGHGLSYTQMSVTPGSHKVLEGLPVVVALDLEGRMQRDVAIRYRKPETAAGSKSGADMDSQETDPQADWTEVELIASEPQPGSRPNEDLARFEMNLGKAVQPVEYQFVTSIGSSDIYRIDVKPLIELDQIETRVAPPAYTKLGTRRFRQRDINVLQGSTVTVKIQTNHPLNDATLETGSKPSKIAPVDVELTADQDSLVWTFELPTNKSLHWKFSGTGHDGTPMSPVKGRLRIRPDNGPQIRWREPADEIMVHTLAEVPVSVQISDDYGLTEAGIVFKLGDDEEFVLTEWMFDSTNEDAGMDIRSTLQLREILPLESFALTERDFISYYAYAIDNREGGVQSRESDIRYIDIRPLRQYYGQSEVVASGGGGNGSGAGTESLRVGLSELIKRQRYTINRTRRLNRSTNKLSSAQLGQIEHLVASQSEMAGLVRFLADFMVSRGNDDVEVLHQAEVAMLQAADSLAAASFDLALVHENDALLALAEARKTVDLFLAMPQTASQRQQLASFSRELRLKLRRQNPPTERQVADSLLQIASEQLEVGQLVSDAKKPVAVGEDESPDVAALDEPGESEEVTEKKTDVEEADADKMVALPDPKETIYTRQIDLLQRMQTVEESLAQRMATSELMTSQMTTAMNEMNQLVEFARDQKYDGFEGQSQAVADRLAELSILLTALQNTEGLARVSTVGDLVNSLAVMENELSAELRSASTAEPSSIARIVEAIQKRIQTVEEVLKTPIDTADLESSEAIGQMQKLVEEAELPQQLQQSQQATGQLAQAIANDAGGDPEPDAFELAYGRAIEFAEVSQQLDTLYQQLVTPQLARLRDLEDDASSLIGKLEESPEAEDDPETKAAMADLLRKLDSAGLDKLMEFLDSKEMSDAAVSDMIADKIAKNSSRATSTSNSAIFNPTTARIRLLVNGLRQQIQEAVLAEISADRDAPVPTQYRTLVDAYFRKLAEETQTHTTGSGQ